MSPRSIRNRKTVFLPQRCSEDSVLFGLVKFCAFLNHTQGFTEALWLPMRLLESGLVLVTASSSHAQFKSQRYLIYIQCHENVYS